MKTALAVLTMTLMEGKAMSEYTVEVIFEPTGDYMHFTYEAESDNEADLCNEILNQLSIVSFKEQ